MKNRKYRTLLSMVCAVLTALFTTLLFTAALTYSVIFRQQNIVRIMEESDWYEQGYQELIRKLEDQNSDTLVPLARITDVITLNRYYIDQREYVMNQLSGTPDTFSRDELYLNLKLSYLTHYEQQGAADEVLDDNVDQITESIVKEYERWIQTSLFRDLGEWKSSCRIILYLLIPFTLAGIIIFTLVLFLMYVHKHKAIWYLMSSFMSVTVLSLGIYFFSGDIIPVNQIGLTVKFYYQFVLKFIENIRNMYLIAAVFSGMAAFVLLLAGHAVKRSYSRE